MSRSAPNLTSFSQYACSPKYSFRAKNDYSGGSEKSRQGPDPGVYGRPPIEVTSKYRRFTANTFGGAARWRNDDKNDPGREPGPGAYNSKSTLELNSGSSFGTSGRTTFKDPPKSQKTPSPGDYEVRGKTRTSDPSVGGGAMYSFTGKWPPAVVPGKNAPGPGAYKPDWSNDYPAPPRFGFGTSTRPPLNMPNDAPAPGTYPIPDGVTGHITFASTPKFSFRSRHFLKADDITSMGPNTAQATSFG